MSSDPPTWPPWAFKARSSVALATPADPEPRSRPSDPASGPPRSSLWAVSSPWRWASTTRSDEQGRGKPARRGGGQSGTGWAIYIYIYICTFGVFLGKPSVDPKLHQK